jgi:outer membrane biosynthesis protein TonB
LKRRNDELNRRYRRQFMAGMLISLAVHLVLFLYFRGATEPPSPFAAEGPRAGDDRAAAGGGMQAVALTLPTTEIIRPPEPIPTPDAVIEQPDEPVPEIEMPSPGELTGAVGPLTGPSTGPGREDGTGQGDGGTAAEGRYRVVPPSPRGMIMPPGDRPVRARGREVAVWVFVDVTGRVIPDSTRLHPGTGDRGFDSRLRRQASEWVFEPARRGGRPVPEWFQYVITL